MFCQTKFLSLLLFKFHHDIGMIPHHSSSLVHDIQLKMYLNLMQQLLCYALLSNHLSEIRIVSHTMYVINQFVFILGKPFSKLFVLRFIFISQGIEGGHVHLRNFRSWHALGQVVSQSWNTIQIMTINDKSDSDKTRETEVCQSVKSYVSAYTINCIHSLL